MADWDRDIPGALNARRDMFAIAADPDLAADTKLFAFCLLTHIAQLRHSGHRGGIERKHWMNAVGTMMYPPDSLKRKLQDPTSICWRIITADAPRYEIPRIPGDQIRCPALKSRGPQAGKPCGKPGAGSRFSLLDHDPETGEQQWIAYCRNHTHPSLDTWRQIRHQAWMDNGCPSPPANTGGALARYFGASFAALYEWADPSWKPTPAGPPSPPNQPGLIVITGGGEGDSEDAPRLGYGDLKVCNGSDQS